MVLITGFLFQIAPRWLPSGFVLVVSALNHGFLVQSFLGGMASWFFPFKTGDSPVFLACGSCLFQLQASVGGGVKHSFPLCESACILHVFNIVAFSTGFFSPSPHASSRCMLIVGWNSLFQLAFMFLHVRFRHISCVRREHAPKPVYSLSLCLYMLW